MYFPNTTWTRLCFAVAVIQCLLALALEAYVFTTVEEGLDPAAYQGTSGHTVPMYLALFIFAFVYEIIIVYDALRLNSMIQLVGVCIYNLLLLLYAAAQPLHVKRALDQLESSLAMGTTPLLNPEHHTWQRIQPAVFAVIVVQAAAALALVFLSYKLHFEFAWVVYKVIHADLSMKKRLLNFQIYLALIKFDFFFLLGFLVQVAALLNNPKHDPELGLSVAGIVVATIVMCCAIYVAKIEHKAGTVGIIVAYLCAAIYLSYKLSVLYDEDNYLLIVFAALTLAMMLCTIVMAGVCMASFDKGLRTYTMPQKRIPEEDIYLNAYRQSYAYPPQSPRMDLVD
ncbi:uncharacterized protein PG986_013056 [Apiospora aurea]|uniref:Uncharacterized protein n=1 Tax=Apiospora aurea TaxID=335848 RepID=A0ABR1Q1S6_9PEZI